MLEKILRLIREPVVLFFLLGFLFFILYSLALSHFGKKKNQIAVTSDQIEILATSFDKIWKRPPSDSELDALIENFVKDEVFYREAIKMGLDKADETIKRRLRQNMELILDDYSSAYPTENQLQSYLLDHTDKFRQDSRISFSHEYFAMAEKEKAKQRLSIIQKGITDNVIYSNSLGLLPDSFDDETETRINQIFGEDFFAMIFDLELGIWQGPIASSYGWHLVRASEKSIGTVPALSEIWDQVEREWLLERKMDMKQEQFEKLRAKYHITIQMPGDVE